MIVKNSTKPPNSSLKSLPMRPLYRKTPGRAEFMVNRSGVQSVQDADKKYSRRSQPELFRQVAVLPCPMSEDSDATTAPSSTSRRKRTTSSMRPRTTQCFPFPRASGPRSGTPSSAVCALAGYMACCSSASRQNWNSSTPVGPMRTLHSQTPGSSKPWRISCGAQVVQDPATKYLCSCLRASLASAAFFAGISSHETRLCSSPHQKHTSYGVPAGRPASRPSMTHRWPSPLSSGPQTKMWGEASLTAGYSRCSRLPPRQNQKDSARVSPNVTTQR
mmetsp:Transcript_64041/g.195844  ORF Transcript_64041/g.195844 Transcript_64041/m.195844 type:complete len:275 (-) Transcript_64041:219-1043(-)